MNSKAGILKVSFAGGSMRKVRVQAEENWKDR